MPITTAQLKAAIEAKIAAATGSTSLEDLTLIKNNADTWLLNNSGSAITGYASLEALIQTKQDALTGSSTIDDVTLTSAAVFPPVTARTIVPKRKTFTLSETWVAPAKIVPDSLKVTGCAGAGSGAVDRDTLTSGSIVTGGQSGEFVKSMPLPVQPGQSFSVLVGAGGLGVSINLSTGSANGNSGGDSAFGNLLLRGGLGGIAADPSSTSAPQSVIDAVANQRGNRLEYRQYRLDTSSTLNVFLLVTPPYNEFKHGSFFASFRDPSPGILQFTGGGDAGLYGPGADFARAYGSVFGAPPAPNTGAGSGGVFSRRDPGDGSSQVSSANGSAGRWDAEWLEYE